jgi:hypothetical protein
MESGLSRPSLLSKDMHRFALAAAKSSNVQKFLKIQAFKEA